MTLEDAKKSLASERAAYRRAAAEVSPEFVIRDGQIKPAEKKSSQLPLIAGAVAAIVSAALLAWLLIGGDDETDLATADNDTLLKPADPATPPIQLPSIDNTAGDAAATSAAPSTAGSATGAAGNAPGTGIGRLDQRLGSLRDERGSATAVGTTTGDAATTTAPDTSPAPPVSTTGAGSSSADAETQETVTPASPAVTPTPAAAGVDRVPAPADAGAPSTAAAQPATETAGAAAPALATPAAASEDVTGLLLDGRVARGNLATAVIQREPVDDLGTSIVGNGEELQTYFFFTELRELAGQRVTHRWIQGGNVVAEIPFSVGDAWRWRVYSSKTFIPSMAGPWRVQVVLEDGSVIYSLPFEFTP